MDEHHVVRNILIPVGSDGCELAGDLFLPQDGTPAPALVTLLPYHKDGEVGIEQSSANEYFAARGFASLLVDFRGTGSSGGRARAPFDLGDADDAADVVEWAAAQPWCNGRVGIWGRSQGAMVALQTAALRPPALKTIVAIGAFIDPELDVAHPHGLRGCLSPLSWGITNLLRQLMPPLAMDAGGRWERVWRDRLDAVEPYLLELVRHGPGDPWWRERAVDVGAVDVPTFCVTGWRDVFLEGSLRAFEALHAPKKLLVGPWMHARPDEAPAGAIDFLAMMAAWWDRWLRGIENGIDREPPVTVFVQGAGEWRRLPRWPSTEPVRLDAGAGGELGPVPRADRRAKAASSLAAAIVTAPPDPTVGVGAGLWYFPSPGWGFPTDHSEDDRRALAFTTAPLTHPLRILGRARVRLRLGTGNDVPESIVAKLTDVDRLGRSTVIVTGAISGRDVATDGCVTIALAPTAYELQPGHALRLTIAGCDFPRLWPDPVPAPLVIACGPRPATAVELPQLPQLPESHGDHGDGGERAEPPEPPPRRPPPAQVLLAQPPRYTVARELITDAVTVTIESGRLIRSMDGASTLHFEHMISANVAASRPSHARLDGTSTVEIATPEGPIRVRVEALVTGGGVSASGEITVAGRQVFGRTWTA